MTAGRSEPRPALRKAADGAMHPAMPRWETPDSAPDASVPDPAPSAFQIANPPGQEPTERDSDRKTAKQKGKGKKKSEGKDKGKGRKKDQGSGSGGSGDLVTVSTTVPKSLRKQAKRKAEAEGRTLEQAVAHLIQVWAGGGHT